MTGSLAGLAEFPETAINFLSAVIFFKISCFPKNPERPGKPEPKVREGKFLFVCQ
jgi:hypothetical protein